MPIADQIFGTEPSVLRSRLKLSIILLLPVLVIAASTLVYVTGIGIPTGTKNRGVLVLPAVSIGDAFSKLSVDKQIDLPGHTGRWSLLYSLEKNCDASCAESLYFMRQLHIALGKYAPRIDRYLIVDSARVNAELSSRYPALGQIYGEKPLRELIVASDSDAEALFYLVDPRGFVMMSYSADNLLKDYITDLKFLFSNSE